jgi:hypothetical protein
MKKDKEDIQFTTVTSALGTLNFVWTISSVKVKDFHCENCSNNLKEPFSDARHNEKHPTPTMNDYSLRPRRWRQQVPPKHWQY